VPRDVPHVREIEQDARAEIALHAKRPRVHRRDLLIALERGDVVGKRHAGRVEKRVEGSVEDLRPELIRRIVVRRARNQAG
jgi:hypothetical protein